MAFLRFFGNTTPYVPKVYMATPIDVVMVKCKIFFRREIGEIVRYLPHRKKIGCLSNCRYCADHAQNLPGPAPNIWLPMFLISAKLVRFRRSYSRTRDCVKAVLLAHRVFAIFAFGRIMLTDRDNSMTDDEQLS